MNSIKMKLCQLDKEINPTSSHFFGSPAVPSKWIDEELFGEFELFICQINLQEIAQYDKENKLPHQGYLYFFLENADDDEYYPIVRYYDGEPDSVLENFNISVASELRLVYDFGKTYGLEFSCDESDEPISKLLGKPYEVEEDILQEGEELLLQYIPTDISFIKENMILDVCLYFFIHQDDLKEKEFDDVGLYIK